MEDATKRKSAGSYLKHSFLLLILLLACNTDKADKTVQAEKQEDAIEQEVAKIPVIFDTDANNELDDQHALTYLLFNGDFFTVKAVTVNATVSGGAVQKHYDEAERIMKLCTVDKAIPLLTGANGNFNEIRESLSEAEFDGFEAVDFIITEALRQRGQPLLLLPVGKLTNIALAILKEPQIKSKVRIVWLGSNYPEPGEYNQVADTAAMSYILEQNVPFEMVTVRYGDPSGTDAVSVTQAEINERMPGKGPMIQTPITGRHGGSFNNFGDYAVDLFKHIDYYGDPPKRALFDLAAVAIVKDGSWAEQKTIPCPKLLNNEWVEQPNNPRQIVVWEHFDRDAIISDLYESLDNPVLAKTE